MSEPLVRTARPVERLDPEKVAYWYFRLNGFLQVENFVVHPGRRGSQRTDADLLGVRFLHRAEFLLHHPEPLRDDEGTLRVSSVLIDGTRQQRRRHIQAKWLLEFDDHLECFRLRKPANVPSRS
jgi:hypothetical protein